MLELRCPEIRETGERLDKILESLHVRRNFAPRLLGVWSCETTSAG